MIRIGLLGLGRISHKIAKTLIKLNSPELILYACGSRELSKAEDFKNKYHLEKAYGSYEELCKDENIDLIYVATPHVFHHDNVILALENNKHVLVEKPMCVSLKEGEELFSLAKEKHLLLQEAFWTRFTPSYSYLKQLIDLKPLGNILSVDASFGLYLENKSRMVSKALGGGVLLDIGVYPLNMLLGILGKNYSIHAVNFSPYKGDSSIDENDQLLISFNDIPCKITISMNQYIKDEAIITCEHGTIILDRNNLVKKIHLKAKNISKTFKFKEIVNGYECQFLKMNQAIKDNSPLDEMSRDDSLTLLRLLDDIRNFNKKQNS